MGDPISPSTALGRALRTVAISVFMAALLVAIAEGGTRVYYRLRYGFWPKTQLAMVFDAARVQTAIYRTHPYLNTASRPDGRALTQGKHIAFNSLGYRSPERPAQHGTGTMRIVTEGGSTTFDLLAEKDERTWPWQLEQALRQRGSSVEVWNAGFPGWTSQENLISLAIRDVDLAPDIVMLFQGINDLQAASHVPFEPQYEPFHANTSRGALALPRIDGPPLSLPWYERSLLFEKARFAVVGGHRFLARTDMPKVDEVSPAGIETFERNVRSFIALARAHGARVVLVTQVIRLRAKQTAADAGYVETWIPGLSGANAVGELERFNDVLRRLATSEGVVLADAARGVEWRDEDFGDPLHFSASGSAKLSAFLADQLQTSGLLAGGLSDTMPPR